MTPDPIEQHPAVIEARNAVMPFVAPGWRVSAIESIDGIIAAAVSKVCEPLERSIMLAHSYLGHHCGCDQCLEIMNQIQAALSQPKSELSE